MQLISDERAREINPNFGRRSQSKRERRLNSRIQKISTVYKFQLTPLPDLELKNIGVALPNCSHGRAGRSCWHCDVIRRRTIPCEHGMRKDRCRKCPGGLKIWAARLFSSSRTRAQKKNLPFDLTMSWIMKGLEKGCPVFKRHFEISKKLGDWSATIDRFKPDLGYTKDNCSIICALANRIKTNTTTFEQVARVAEWMQRIENIQNGKINAL